MSHSFTASRRIPFVCSLLIAALAASTMAFPAAAASFAITSPSTAAQTLGPAAGQTGSIAAGSSLTVGGSGVAVTVSGNNATLTNLGMLSQTGTGRAVRDNTGVSGLTITNGSASNATALMQAADADVVQLAQSPASVLLNNYGQMISLNASAGGAQVVDFNAIVSGSNVVNNFAGALMKADEADAVRPGANGVVFNAGTIVSVTTTGSSSDGVDLQNNSGVQVSNAASGVVEGGRHGITGGALDATVSFSAGITNQVGGLIRGDNGSGLNFDGYNARQLVTVVNGGLIVGNGVTGDGDGVDVDGLVSITNTGTIRSANSFSAVSAGLAYSEGISVGGGTITNSGTIEGLVATGNTNAVGRGITLAGNDITSGPLAGTREAIYGNAVIVNNAGGLIRGQTDSAIVVGGPASGFTVAITNNAGASIVGGSSSAAAIRTGADNDTLINGGRIDGSSSGKAIDLGAGDNTLRIVGGNAVVLGDISGGLGGSNTMTLAAGAGNAFTYAGAVSNFASVEVQSGTVRFSGASRYTGTTILSGGTLILDGIDRLAAASALRLAGGSLALLNAVGVNGQSFASLALSADSSVLLNGSGITFGALGELVSGASLTIDGFVASGPLDYAFRLLGNFTDDARFMALLGETTIDGLATRVRFDGTYTDVSAAVAPVPEPSTLGLMMGGFGVLVLTVRRRRVVSR